MKKNALGLLVVLACSAVAAAQENAKPKPDDPTPAVIPLRVQVVFTEYDGEKKKVTNLPYTFTVNADERRARPGSQIRTGARIPVATGKDQYTYLDVGTNVDCSATLQHSRPQTDGIGAEFGVTRCPSCEQQSRLADLQGRFKPGTQAWPIDRKHRLHRSHERACLPRQRDAKCYQRRPGPVLRLAGQDRL